MSNFCILSSNADKDIDRLYEDGIRKHGMAQADRYVLGIDHVLALIADNPRLGRLRTEISPPVRTHPYQAHILIYRLSADNRPVILAVKHASEAWIDQDYPDT